MNSAEETPEEHRANLEFYERQCIDDAHTFLRDWQDGEEGDDYLRAAQAAATIALAAGQRLARLNGCRTC